MFSFDQNNKKAHGYLFSKASQYSALKQKVRQAAGQKFKMEKDALRVKSSRMAGAAIVLAVLILLITAAIFAIPAWKWTFSLLVLILAYSFGLYALYAQSSYKKAHELSQRHNLGLSIWDILGIYKEGLPPYDLVYAYVIAKKEGLDLDFENIKKFYAKNLAVENVLDILRMGKNGEIQLNQSYFKQYLLKHENTQVLLDVYYLAIQLDLPTTFQQLVFLHSKDLHSGSPASGQKSHMEQYIENLIVYIKGDPEMRSNFEDWMHDFRNMDKLERVVKAKEKCNKYNINWSKDEIKAYKGDPFKMIDLFIKARSRGLTVTIQELIHMEEAGIKNMDAEIDNATKEQEEQIGPFTTYTSDEQPIKLAITLTYKNNLQYALKGRELKSLTHKIKEAYTTEIGNTKYERIFGKITEISRRVKNRHFDAQTKVEFVELAVTQLELVSIYGAPHKLEKANYDRAVNEAVAEKVKSEADAESRKARARIKDMEARIKEAKARFAEEQFKGGEYKSEE